jgi:hypothetical protein
MTLEREDFAIFGKWLGEANIPTGAILEGGYSGELPELIDAFLSGWIERDPPTGSPLFSPSRHP